MGDDEHRVFFNRDFDNWSQAQRLQAHLEGRDLPKFSLCLNLGDIPPENVKLSITDRVINVSGYIKDVIEDEDGMIRETFHGFCNEFGLPEGLDPVTLRVNDNHDQSITIEADYYIPYGHLQEGEVSRPISGIPSSVPSAHSQRDHTISHQDETKSFLPPSNNSPPSSPRRTMHPAFNVATAFSPNQIKPLQHDTLPLPSVTPQVPSQFNVPSTFSPCQTINLPNDMSYAEKNTITTPHFGSREMKILRSTYVPLRENNSATLFPFNTSKDASTGMQYRCNYSRPSNQAIQRPVGIPPHGNTVAFSQFPPAPQFSLRQMKALQQNQRSSADSSYGLTYQDTSLFTPQELQPNRHRSESSPSSIHHEAAALPAQSYSGKQNNIPDVPCLVNRFFLKPGTRCETHPSTAASKHDYRIPGTRRASFAQNRGEGQMENRSHSFHNVPR